MSNDPDDRSYGEQDEVAPAPAGPLRIHTVAALTGVPEPTLRAWERRYGVPTPERTSSNYRVYGEHDVAQIREMRALCQEGMATAEAAQRVLERSEASPRLDRPAGGDAYSAAVRALTDAMVRFDDVAFEEHLRRASYLGSSTLVFERVLVPILARVGELWREGHVSIAQEHFVSQSIATLVRDLTRIVARSDARDAAIVACFADEDHEIGALGVALRLSTWGVRPVFLGARTPPAAIRSAVESLDPALVALSVTVSPERARCRELLDGYGSACAPIPWIVGGQGVDAMADLVAHAGGTVGPAETKRLHAVVGQTLARSSSPRARP